MDRKSQVALQEELIRLGEAAFDPALPQAQKEKGVEEFKTFLDRSENYVSILLFKS